MNVTPISDVAIRQSTRLTDSGAQGWFAAASETIEWDRIRCQYDSDCLGSGDNEQSRSHSGRNIDATIGDPLALYELRTVGTDITLSVRGSAAQPVTIPVSGGIIGAPADRAALDALRDAAAMIVLPAFGSPERIVANDMPALIVEGQTCTVDGTACETGLECQSNVCAVPSTPATELAVTGTVAIGARVSDANGHCGLW